MKYLLECCHIFPKIYVSHTKIHLLNFKNFKKQIVQLALKCLKHVFFLSRWSSKGIRLRFHTFVLILQNESNRCACSGGNFYMKVSIFCILSYPILSHHITFYSILFYSIHSHPISSYPAHFPLCDSNMISYPTSSRLILSCPDHFPSHPMSSFPTHYST